MKNSMQEYKSKIDNVRYFFFNKKGGIQIKSGELSPFSHGLGLIKIFGDSTEKDMSIVPISIFVQGNFTDF